MRTLARLLCSSAVLFLGCGNEDTGDLPDNPAARLVATPSAVIFGRVPVGATGRQTVRLENVGNADSEPLALLAGSNVTCDRLGPDQTFCLELPEGLVPAGGAVEAAVVYTARAPGPPEETAWTIGCGEGCEVRVTGRGSGAETVLAGPEMIDFGRLFPGCTAAQTVTYTSEVDVPLEVQALEIEADRDGIYGVELPMALPFVLEAEGTLALDVNFAAQDGDLPAIVRITFGREGYGLVDDYTLVRRLDIIGRGDPADPPCD